MLGRIKDAVEDVAETIKRAFSGPKVHSASSFFIREPESKTVTWLMADAKVAGLLSTPDIVPLPLFVSASTNSHNMKFVTQSFSETGEVFKADAVLVSISLVWSGVVVSADIPGMNSPAMKRLEETYAVIPPKPHAIPQAQIGIKYGKTYSINTQMKEPECYKSLERALLVPIHVKSEDLEGISRALLMRYGLQLVKETGENIKNLEIIGLYKIPKKGLKSVKHDAASGTLKIIAGADAQNSQNCIVLVARKKSNSAIVSCMLDDS